MRIMLPPNDEGFSSCYCLNPASVIHFAVLSLMQTGGLMAHDSMTGCAKSKKLVFTTVSSMLTPACFAFLEPINNGKEKLLANVLSYSLL